MKARSIETALEKVSRVITDRYGLRLVCEGNSCKTDGRIIYLPSLPEDVPEELLGAVRGCADHECVHAIYTQTRAGPAFHKKHGPQVFAILNALEDARVERLMSRKFPGAKLNIEDAFRFLCEIRHRDPTADTFRSFVSALYTRASGRPDQPWISKVGYELAQDCRAELSELASCRNTKQVADLTLRIWEKMRELFEAKEQEAEVPDASGATGQGTHGQAGQVGSGDGQSQEPEGSPQDRANGRVSPADTGPGGSAPMDQLKSLIENEVRALCPPEASSYRAYTTRYDVVEVPEPDRNFDHHREMEALRPYVSGVRRRLLQTLMGRSETRWLGDKAKGRLDPRALHRLTAGRSVKVFRQHAKTKGGATACSLLLDLSSSMSGAQIELCKQLALVFAETLHVIGFATEVIGFSTVDRDLRSEVAQESGADIDDLAKRFARFVPLYHAIYKQFNEHWLTAAARFGGIRTQSLTPLGESLLFAGKRLAHRPEKRKVLFCLTDGKPVVGAWDEQVTLNHACETVRKLSQAGIEPVGIGILEPLVADIFPRHAVIHALQELPQGFLGQLCSVLTDRR